MKRLLPVMLGILQAACAAAPNVETPPAGLTFVHMNDTYRVGAVEDGHAGGLSRVTTVVRELQAEGRDVRVLHGGDFLYPSLESSLWNGMQMVDAMNFIDNIAPLYVVAGNHEFDSRTSNALIDAVRGSKFDWIGDNYRFVTGDEAVDSALVIAFTAQHGDKTIGVFSLTLHADDGGNGRDYVLIDKDFIASATAAIENLEAVGVDAIIGLTHLHLWQDLRIAELREQHPKFVFIAGGHDHEPEYSPLNDKNAAVFKGASNARVIWTIDLNFDATGAPSVKATKRQLDESVAVDSDYLVLENKWRSQLLDVLPFLEARVGTAAVPLDAREVTVRSEESSWANFIVDQMRTAFGDPIADLAFINGGTLRIDDYIAGDILFEDIGRTFGFSSHLRHTTLTGGEFRKVMEAGYRGFGGTQGFFPQVSGFRVCVDRHRKEGDRIVSLQVPDGDLWTEIDHDKVFSLVVPDFLYGGGDGYEVPHDRPVSRPGSELIYLVLDGILDAQSRGEMVGKAVDPEDPRYHELLEAKQPCFR
jgi:2',3'-cyclic-nucleotide 2'-phosphodiesterase (5'-nucleotidase family)